MKTFLFDFTNFGIVYVSTTGPRRWQLSLLRSCLLDTNIGQVAPSNALYENFNNQSITEQFYYLDRNNGISIGEQHEVNEYQLEKQQRAKLMMPLIDKLTSALSRRSFNSLNEYGIPMDDTIAFEVTQSDPDTGNFSSGIIEYATALEITPMQAYQELQLDYKTHHAVKMRTYATTIKYISMIRDVRTQEQADQVQASIQQKLINDTFI
jgi:hypothetical protein